MKRYFRWALLALAAFGCWAAIQQARLESDTPAVEQKVVTTRPGVVIYGLVTAIPVAVVALAVLFGAQAGAKVLGGVQRWQGPLQTVNAFLIVGIGAYLTLSGSLGLL